MREFIGILFLVCVASFLVNSLSVNSEAFQGGHAPSQNCQDIVDALLKENRPKVPPCPAGYCPDQEVLDDCTGEYDSGLAQDAQTVCLLLRQNTNTFLDTVNGCLLLPTTIEIQACMNQALFDWDIANDNIYKVFNETAVPLRQQEFEDCLSDNNYCKPCESDMPG